MDTDEARIPRPWNRSCYVCGEENSRGLRQDLVEGEGCLNVKQIFGSSPG